MGPFSLDTPNSHSPAAVLLLVSFIRTPFKKSRASLASVADGWILSHSVFFAWSFKEADLVTTHELGHNFGAEHDPDGLAECAPNEDQGGKYVMYPIAVSGDHENNKVRIFWSFFGLGRKEAIPFNYNESSEEPSIPGMELWITKYPQTWLCALEWGVVHQIWFKLSFGLLSKLIALMGLYGKLVIVVAHVRGLDDRVWCRLKVSCHLSFFFFF